MTIGCLKQTRDLMKNWMTQGNLAVFYVFSGLLASYLLQMVIAPFLHIYGKYVLGDLDLIINFTCLAETNNGTNKTLNLQNIYKNGTHVLENKDVIVETAFLFASKSIAEAIALPIIGLIADRIDNKTSFLIGVFLAFVSAVTFPFCTSYKELILSRTTLGIGAALITSAGYWIVVDMFRDPVARTNAVAIVTYAVYFGDFAGAPLGGLLYHFAGYFLPFIILASLCLFTFIFVLFANRKLCGQCLRNKENRNIVPIYNFLVDPHMMIPIGVLFISNLPVAFLNPVLSTWMSETMCASEWQIGMTWIPTFCANTSGTYIGAKLAKTFPRHIWLIAVVGEIIVVVSTISIPYIRLIYLVMVPIATVWFGMCLIDTSVIPHLGYIADTRYNSVYGSTFSLMALAYALANALSGVLSGIVMKQCGFSCLNLLTASCNLIYIPLLLFLRKGNNHQNDETIPIYKQTKSVTNDGN